MAIQQGMLRMLVVQRLMRSPASGYTLVKDISESTGWKPSFGSIYPLLEKMQHDGYVTVKEAGRSKVYSLTKEGKQMIEQQRERRVQAFSQLTEQMRVLNTLNEDHVPDFSVILDTLKRGEVPFQEVPEAIAVRQELFRLLHEGKTKTKRKELRTIMSNTLKELKRL